jgi:hypothetical protein
VLDKGLVIDAEIHIAVVGIELVTVNALVKIASFETWNRHAAGARPSRRHRVGPATARAERVQPQGAPAAVDPHRVRLHCEDGCTFERSASTLLLRDGRLAHQRCAVKPGVRCAVAVV